MNKAILIILLFIGFGAAAQSDLDSNFVVWQDENQPDSVRVKAYSRFVWVKFLFSQTDTAILMTQELIRFGEENDFPQAIANAYNILGVAQWLKS